MADNSFKIVAKLDIPTSVGKIINDIPKLEKTLQANAGGNVKIVAGLDTTRSIKQIQSQLNAITAPTIKIGIDTSSIQNTQNITNGLRDVQTQAQQTANSLTNLNGIANQPIKPILDRSSFTEIQDYIDAIAIKLSKTKIGNFSDVFKGIKANFNANTPDIKNAVAELVNAIKLTPNNQKAITDSYSYLMDMIRNTINSSKIVNSQDFEMNLADQIYRIATSMNNAQSQIQQSSTAINNSLQQVQQSVQQTGNSIQQFNNVSTSSKNYFSNSSEILKDIQLFDMEEDAIKSLETTFKSLGATVTSVERKNNSGFTESFTVAIRSATGEVEKFDYIWKNLNEGISDDEKWRYALSNITATDKGVKNLIESAKIAKDKLNAIADTKQNKLMSLYSGAGQGAKPIQNADSWIKLAQQAGIAEEAIEKIRTADTTTANSIKANADIEIDKFKQLVRTLQNVEYAANSLRVKDIFTTKRIETTNLDNLINKINKSDVPFEKLRRHIDVLKSSLSNVTNQESLVKYLNSFDRVESKFKSLNTLYTSIGGYDKQLDKLARDWQKQGIYIGNVKTTVENLKKSLATVKTSDGFTKWVSDFNSQIGALDKLPITIAKGRNELNSLQQTWTDFSKGKNIVSNVNKELGNLSSRIKRITTEKGFSKWSEDFSKINTQISQMTTNLNNQVSVQNKINKLQTQIAKLNPARDIDEIARLNKKLKLEQKELSNLQYQSNLFSNLISLAEQEKYITQQTVQTREMLTSAINSSTAKYKSDINETIKNLNRLKNSTLFKNNQNNSQVTAIQQQITDLTTRYQNMLNTLNKGNLTPTQFDALQKELKQLNTDFNSTQASATRFQQTLRSDNSADQLKQKVALLTAQIKAFRKANSKSEKSFGNQYDALLNALANPNIDHNEYTRLAKEFQILRQNVNAAGSTGKNFFEDLGASAKKFIKWMSMTYVLSSITRSFRALINNVVELDSAMVSLKKVTDETEATYSKFFDNVSKKSQKLGTTMKSLIDSASDFAKLGYSIDEASTLAEVASVYANVGELDIEDATSSIVSTMAAFGIEAENAIKIIDKFNAVGNNFSITSGDIGSALQRSASSLNASGNTLDEAIAMITAANTVVQDADVIGTAMKTVSLRLTSTSAQLEELGEDTEYACETISDYRNLVMGLTHNKVDILGDDGQYLSTYEIIKKLSEVWKELNSMEQSSLMKSLFGVRQANVGVSLIEQFDIAERVLKESIESEGSAMEEHSRWLDSITAKTQQFKASFESLSITALNNQIVKDMVDVGTKLLNIIKLIVEKLGTIPTILIGILTVKAFKNIGIFKQINYDVNNLTQAFKNLNQGIAFFGKSFRDIHKDVKNYGLRGLTSVVTKQDVANFNSFTTAIQNGSMTYKNAFDTYLSKAPIALKRQANEIINLTNEQRRLDSQRAKGHITQEQYTSAMDNNRRAMQNLTTQIETLTSAQRVANATSKILAFSLNMLANIGLSLVINEVVREIYKFINASKEAEEQRKEAIDMASGYKSEVESLISSYNQESSSLQELQTRYVELISATNDINTIKSDLSSLQDEIVEKYGLEADQIDLMNDKYAENIHLMQERRKEQAEAFLFDNAAKIKEAEGRQDSNYVSKISIPRHMEGQTDIISAFNDIAGKEIVDIDTTFFKKKYNITIDDDNPQKVYDTLVKIANVYQEISEAQGTYSSTTHQYFIDEANRVKSLIEGDDDLLKQAQDMRKVIDDFNLFENADTSKAYNDGINQLIEFNQKFKETASTAGKIDLSNKFTETYKELQNLTKGNSVAESELQSLFDTMDSGLTQLKNNATSSASLYKETLKTYLSDEGTFNDTNDNIAKYTGALDDLSEKGIVTASVMNDLIALDSDLINSFTKVGDGFHISTDTLIASKDKLINKELEYVETEQKSSKKVLTDLKLQLRETEKQRDKTAKFIEFLRSVGDINQANYLQNQLDGYDTQIENITQEIAEVENATDHWNNIQSQLNSSLGDTTSHLKELENQADALEDTIDKLEESIDKIESEISDLEDKQSELLEYQEYQIDNIINKIESEKEVLEKEKEVLEEQVTALEEQQEQLEELISNYEKVVDVISDVVDKQIEAIETERDAVEKHYDDIIEKLQEQNEEREKAITLAEKQANLENAQRNKIRQYNEQTGWTYVQDQEAIYNAQKELDDFKAQDEIDTLEKEKENALKGYDEQIEAWEEYVKLWEDTVDGYTEAEDNLIAEQILGSDWLEKIKNKDTTTLNTFKNNYNTYQNTLNTVIQREIDSLNQSIKAKEKDIEAKEKQIDSWNDYKNELSNYVDSVSKKWSDYVSMVGQVTLDENSSLEERASNLETFKNNYSAITDQILAKQGELAGMTAELESAQGTLEALQERIDFVNSNNIASVKSQIATLEGLYESEKAHRDNVIASGINSEHDANYINDIANTMNELQETIRVLYESIGEVYNIPHYSTGGVNTTTGVSWLDGTPSKPELVLNNSQATKLWNLLNTMSSSQLAKTFRLDSLGQPPESLRQLANNSSMVTNNQNSQSINLIFNGNIIANNPVDFMQQMNSYVQHNKLNGWIRQG